MVARERGHLGEALGTQPELQRAEHPVGGCSVELIGRDLTTGVTLITENRSPRTSSKGQATLISVSC